MQTRVRLIDGVSVIIDFEKIKDKQFGNYLFKVILSGENIADELNGMNSILKVLASKVSFNKENVLNSKAQKFIKDEVNSKYLYFENLSSPSEFHLELITKIKLCEIYSDLFSISNNNLDKLKLDEASSRIRTNDYKLEQMRLKIKDNDKN